MTQKISININSERALQTVVCCVHMGVVLSVRRQGWGLTPF